MSVKQAGDGGNDGGSTLLEFPCRFPIKMMGRDKAGFRETVIDIVSRHAGPVSDEDVRSAPSSKGTFISITVTVTATSQDQLDDIYRELTAHEDVLVGL